MNRVIHSVVSVDGFWSTIEGHFYVYFDVVSMVDVFELFD